MRSVCNYIFNQKEAIENYNEIENTTDMQQPPNLTRGHPQQSAWKKPPSTTSPLTLLVPNKESLPWVSTKSLEVTEQIVLELV